MDPVIEISLSAVAWLIALNRGWKALVRQPKENSPIALEVGAASWFFALTMTFLITPLSQVINPRTFPNLTRLLAYSCVSITLYLTTTAALTTIPSTQNQRQRKFLKLSLIVTLAFLILFYIAYVSRSNEWVDKLVPGSVEEMIYKLALYAYAALLCSMIAVASFRYLNQEHVVVTRYRIVMITLTAVCGGGFFLAKAASALGYLWSFLGARWLHQFSNLLFVGTVMLWGASFIHSNRYARALAMVRGFRTWATYQDLVYLVNRLERLCPPIGMQMSPANFWQFVLNSDYYLYRTIIHILDSKTLIADFLKDTTPINQQALRWGEEGYIEAVRLTSFLQRMDTREDYLDLISSYRQASRRLRNSTN